MVNTNAENSNLFFNSNRMVKINNSKIDNYSISISGNKGVNIDKPEFGLSGRI